jgi:DNA-binding GntR family transcriptional regulator
MTMPPGPASAEPATLREKAYDAFTRHLLRRDIKPGQFVSQRELVAMTGMPLGAIRELVPRLEAEGLIRTIPQRGMQVAHVDLNLIRNAFQFRLFLEREAVAVFTSEASDATIAAHRRAHELVVEQAEAGAIGEALIEEAQQIDRIFHEAIVDHLGNEIISNAYRVNWIKIRLIAQNETSLYDFNVVPVMQEHLGIIAAIEARDPARAAGLLAQHISNARARALTM